MITFKILQKQKKSSTKRAAFYEKISLKLCSLNGSRPQTCSTYVDSFSSTVHISFNGLDVGFPHFVGSSMRMAHIASEMSAFFTNCTLCHGKHLLDIY